MKELEPIRIGRIARATERALGLSLTGEVGIFMNAKDLDALASKRPNDYLKVLEEIGQIIHDPDFVSFDDKKESIRYVKFYFKEGAFSAVAVGIKKSGRPAKWRYENLLTVGKMALPFAEQGISLVRPIYKKVLEKTR